MNVRRLIQVLRPHDARGAACLPVKTELTIEPNANQGYGAGACRQAAFFYHEAARRRAAALPLSEWLRLRGWGATARRSGEGGFAELDALRDLSHGG